MDFFKALLIEQRDGKVVGNFVRPGESWLDAGNATICLAYSAVDFKEARTATGGARIIRCFSGAAGRGKGRVVVEIGGA